MFSVSDSTFAKNLCHSGWTLNLGQNFRHTDRLSNLLNTWHISRH